MYGLGNNLYDVTTAVRKVFLGVRDFPQQKPLHMHPEVLNERRGSSRGAEVQPFVDSDDLTHDGRDAGGGVHLLLDLVP